MNDTGRGAIEIKHCGDALCGNVVWVKNAADAKGCGKQIIGNVAAVGGGRWDNGWIYSPERGRKYSVELTPLKDGTLRVTGYAGLKFLSKTMIWTRAPENLQLCNRPIDAKAGQPGSKPADGATVAAKTDAKGDVNATASAANAKPAATPKSPANYEVAIATPAPKILNPNATPQTPPTSASNGAAAAPPPANGADEKSKSQASAAPPTPAQDTAKEQPAPDAPDAMASAGDSGSDLQRKLDDMGLGKVFTKTKSGKCKIDLPWVKISVDCED
jgi:hypothetical protein